MPGVFPAIFPSRAAVGSHCTPETPRDPFTREGNSGTCLSHAAAPNSTTPTLSSPRSSATARRKRVSRHLVAHQQIPQPRSGTGLSCPCLNLNGYKINNPTLLARISHDELEDLFKGYGYSPCFVEGSDPETMHQAFSTTLDHCVQSIRTVQQEGRKTGVPVRPRWPMIILRTPKGWTRDPPSTAGHRLEGSWRAIRFRWRTSAGTRRN